MTCDVTDPPSAYGDGLFTAVFKQQADDFKVIEQLDTEFSGSGEHLYLSLEKTSMNTDEIVSLLQACYSVPSADIGFCGLKDRHSVSQQWSHYGCYAVSATIES